MPELYPVPNKLFIAEFPTSDRRDVYLYQHFDSKATENPEQSIPEFGDPVPQQYLQAYPDHKLVMLAPTKDAGDGWVTAVWASDREDQDSYNYDVTYPLGSTRFARIERTYVFDRAQYQLDGPLALSTADPGLKEDGSVAFPGAVLSEAEQMKEGTGDNIIDSLYVLVRRVFEQIPDLSDPEQLAEAKVFGYKVEYPYSGSTSYPRVTWTIPNTSEATAASGSSCPIAGYTSCVLVDQQYVNEKGIVIGLSRVYDLVPEIDNGAGGNTNDASVLLFGYMVEYPYGVVAYPRVTWRVPCTSESTSPTLSDTYPCPIAGYSTGAFGAGSQKLQLIDQKYQRVNGAVVGAERVYECNPGPIIVESEYDPRTKRPVKITKQVIAAASIPATAALMNAEINSYGSKTVTSVVSGTVNATAHGLVAGDEFYFSLTRPRIDLLGTTTATSTTLTVGSTTGVTAGDTIDGIGVPAATTVTSVLTSATIQMSAAATATNTGIPITINILNVPNGDASGTAAYYVATAATNSFTFTERVGFTASALSGGSGSVKNRLVARGTTIEYKPMGMDALRAVKITTQLDITDLDYMRGAADRVYYSTHPYNWPDVLNSARYICVTTDLTGDPVGDVALILDITEGARGPSRARITERWTSNPAATGFISSLPAITRFKPKAHSLGMVRIVASGGQAQLSARTFTIPATLHDNITVAIDAYEAAVAYTQAGYIEQDIPATDDYTYIPGGWIVADVQPEQYNHGMWLFRLIEVTYE